MSWACFDNILFFTEIIWTGIGGALHWSEGLQADTEGICLFIRRCSRSISFYLHHSPHANIKLYKDDMLGLIRDPFLTQHSFCTKSQGNQSWWENQSIQWVKTWIFRASFMLCTPFSTTNHVLGWPESSFSFFHIMLWKNPNEHFGQPNSFRKVF